ncbi:glycoside hydrolase family 3 protein [Planctobacterium marinum]|uniref:Glucan 1,4-beta-glucosidase n=1 Tax=Planctobacterium marinum TaxID=1631968 RepID=A0AA48HP87_9ALTE|nr:glucan 1,4-beta-glucosidase [Planctobacterium marinum]
MKLFNRLKNSRSAFYPLLLTSVILGCSPADKTPATHSEETEAPDSLAIWPELKIEIQRDEETEARVKQLLATMTLEQKVAQIIQPEIRDITVEDMRKYGFGSYLNGGGGFPNNNKHSSIADWVTLAEQMYQASVDDSLDGSSIPTMWGTDAVHGHNNVIGATIFPHNIGLGAANDPGLIKRIAAATSIEVQATGIDWIFAPTVAAARNDRWGRTYESYSEDPEIIGAYSRAIVEGLQGDKNQGFFADDKVISTVKHFIGDGGTVDGDDQGNNIDSEQELFDIHAQGYVHGLTAGSQSVMASFNSWHGKKIHGSEYLLTKVLKEKMGFDGFVVGDWNGHGQIQGCTNDNCPAAINAGLDIYMVPTQAWKPLYENLIKQVKSGEILQSRLDDAVTRVLRVKARAGILDKPSPANRKYAGKAKLIGAQAHRDIAREAVRKSLVLLKNNNQLLPLAPTQKILVAGDGADNIGKQSGGWSITWQGTGNTNEDFPGGSSIYQGIEAAVSQAGGQVELAVDGKYQEKPDVAIVVFGEEPYAEGNGDVDNVEYQRGSKSDLALLKKLKAQDIPVVSLFISGRPMWVNAEINHSDAFVAVWLPGTEAQGIADVLFTDPQGEVQYDFEGRLSFSWPASPDQQANRHDGQSPLFAYGYGLSYDTAPQNLPLLNEEVEENNNELPVFALYQGSVKAPWELLAITDNSRIQMTSSVLDSAELTIKTRDRRIQEDALQLTWQAPASMMIFKPFPEDFLRYLENDASLFFDVNIQSLGSSVALNMICMDPCDNNLDLTPSLSQLTENEWHTLQVPFSCLKQRGVNFSKLMAPFELSSSTGTQMLVSDIVIARTEDYQSGQIPQICDGE